MLEKQCNLYSVDTGHFYSNHEKCLHNKINQIKQERNSLFTKLQETNSDTDEYCNLLELIHHKKEKEKFVKLKLLTLLSNKVSQNLDTNGRDHIRKLRESALNDNHVISVFDSALTRALDIKQDELSDKLIVVQVYYFDIFKDLCFYGFTYKGEKYQYFSSSAGQIRQKKAVFIKKSTWKKIEKNIMCGLTLNKINAMGGNNATKHLAYLALSNSATDVWKEFNIEQCIVIDDFETSVYGTFDLVNEKDYSITRKTDVIPIPHTDGAGMMLPSVSAKNFMFRAPWIKGLLGVFDFRKFIERNDCSPIILDIYGKEHHILNEDIRIIFTKSQFKMHKYYDSWEQYKEYFKKYQCTAGICNIEEERFKNAKINYQMLQSLTDITEEEIDLLAKNSSEKIKNICSSQETMMELLGITPYNTHPTAFQQAVKLYPALLNDTFAKDVIRDIKNSLLKKYRSGKLEINGKYTFILPDFYAACEYWFLHIQTPTGLLNDQEVFCYLLKHAEKLDCLRSPHLYREHAIRHNIANSAYDKRTDRLREWFTTNGLYTSTHDLISKLLQFDVDGDKSLVVADPDFIRIAERNMKGIVPLYYNMRKAEPTQLNNETIYTGLSKAFTSGNIGSYSNAISKIWNHEIFLTGNEQEKQEALTTIKLLCMENNFCIDYAKTLYMPKRAPWFQTNISKYTKNKLPAFFEFAKDKDSSQLMSRNASLVNRLYEKIPDRPISTRNIQLERLNYKKLMKKTNIRCTREVSSLYDTLNRQYRYKFNQDNNNLDNFNYVTSFIRKEFAALGYDSDTIADMLVQYLYGSEKRSKHLLWSCYGEYLVANLIKNLKPIKQKVIQCIDCGEWIEVSDKSKSTRCSSCQKEHRKKLDRERKQKNNFPSIFYQ